MRRFIERLLGTAVSEGGEGSMATRQGRDRRNAPSVPGQQDQTYHLIEEGKFLADPVGGAFRANPPALTGRVEVKLTWDHHKSPADLFFHLSAFLVDGNGRVPGENPYWCVNHDNNRSKDGSTDRHGYKQHGAATRDETIVVRDLQDVDEDVERIVIVAYLQTGAVEHSFIEVIDGVVTFTEHAEGRPDHVFERHPLDGDYRDGRAVIVGELERREASLAHGLTEWVYLPIGEGRRNLKEAGAEFGVIFI